MFLDKQFLKRCLFVDIETVSEVPTFEMLSDQKKDLWSIKADQLRRFNSGGDPGLDDAALFAAKAGIFAEFSKIVCISMGFLHFEGEDPVSLRIKSLAGDDEHRILEDFNRILVNHYNDPENSRICGHNIKEFDIPFLCRRMVIGQVKFPPILDISGKKPWQTSHILDTMDMWRFGDFKNYTSLALLAGALGIPSPKDEMDGSAVGYVFWTEEDIDKIVTYCQKDVTTVVQVMMRYAGLPLLQPEAVELINQKE